MPDATATWDRNHAYERALAIMEKFEAYTRQKLGGRIFVRFGAWRCDPESLKVYMREHLYLANHPPGKDLDDMLFDFLEGYSNAPLETILTRRQPEFRQAALQRRSELDDVDLPAAVHESNPVHRNESPAAADNYGAWLE